MSQRPIHADTIRATGTPASNVDAPDLPPSRLDIAAEFRYFAEHRAGTYAPLYARLADAIADDPVLLDVAACARNGQSRPDLLLALIHDLLLREPDQPAARFYPSIHRDPDRTDDPAPDVLELAHNHRDELVEHIANRLVQTNEVGRCTFLTPAVQAAARLTAAPLALLEVGASAGLNLMLDRYGYRYHHGVTDGEESTPAEMTRPGTPTLHCELRGPELPPLDQPLPIRWRAGIDLRPVDITNADDRRWLCALVWPDHRVRAAQLATALATALAAPHRPTVHPGDAASVLPRLAAAAASEAHLIVYHSAVLAHMPDTARHAFTASVLACSQDRPVSWVQAEPRPDGDPRRLRLVSCSDGRITADRALGSYQPHGQWLHWIDNAE